MKITFGNPEIKDNAQTASQSRHRVSAAASRYAHTAPACYSRNEESSWQIGRADKEKGKSLLELQQEAENADVGIQQDYMTLMSHTLSEEDYARLEEEGFRFESMDPQEAVTIVDKIKAELVRSGKQIAGYTDDLNLDTLAAALGSTTLAREITNQLNAMDIPLNRENAESLIRAWDMASQLTQPRDGEMAYLLEQELEPEIWDLYLAQNSGAGDAGRSRTAYYAQEVPGYYVKTAQELPEDYTQQLDGLLEQIGREPTQENREKASWLLEHGIALEEEQMKRLETARSIAFPVTEETFARAAAIALSEGKDALHGNLDSRENIYRKAVRLLEEYGGGQMGKQLEENLRSRRQLEEIRLRMTVEVNVKLLKSGFQIDTAPAEELIEALRQAEREIAEQYFPGESDPVEKYELLQQTNQVVEELPGLPAQNLGRLVPSTGEDTLDSFYRTGKELEDKLQKAQERYESLMTAPRKDLGDHIRKAFANVDDILSDMGQELNEENRRAVRILGYNHMEITRENLAAAVQADEQVRTIINKMTPASVLKMIRDGVNPLEQTFPQLEEYLDSLPQDYQEQAESYSRFLYGLERNREITPQERDGYIGIYRLLHQIEHTDGAAVGAVLQSNAQLQFSNLLTGVRNGRFKGMDQKVGDSFGEVIERVRKGETIPEQIGKAFQKELREYLTDVSGWEDSEKQYRKQSYEQMKALAGTEEAVISMLDRAQLPLRADYLLAGQAMLQHADNSLRRHLERRMREEEAPADDTALASELVEQMDSAEEFQSSYARLLTQLQREVEESTLQKTDSVDVKQLQLLHKQLTVAGALGQAEEFFVPLYVGEELHQVHLIFERGAEQEKGSIRITVDGRQGEGTKAFLQLSKGHISGYYTENDSREVTKLDENADIFRDLKQEGALENGNSQTLYRVAKAFLKGYQGMQ